MTGVLFSPSNVGDDKVRLETLTERRANRPPAFFVSNGHLFGGPLHSGGRDTLIDCSAPALRHELAWLAPGEQAMETACTEQKRGQVERPQSKRAKEDAKARNKTEWTCLVASHDKRCRKRPWTVPSEALDTIFEFLDGNGLLSCESVSYRWRLETDRTRLWERACLAAFPHLRDAALPRQPSEAPYACCGAYDGDWRETFLDGNRGNRSAVLDWEIGGVGRQTNQAGDGGDSSDDESHRRSFYPFRLGQYPFTLLADPNGNPRAAEQAEAAGAPPVEKGLSLYLAVAFPEQGLFSSARMFPELKMEQGPGHPWAPDGVGDSSDDEKGEEGRRNGSKHRARVSDRDGRMHVTRDPHRLKHRRRRWRRRAVRDSALSEEYFSVDVECCASFALSAINRKGGRDLTWTSSMTNNRFCPGRSSWGVHCLLPLTKMQDPAHGFVDKGNLTVRLRVRLLKLTVHLYRTSDLKLHRGFGVVPCSRDLERPERNASPLEMSVERPYGILPCMSIEVLQCTSLQDLRGIVAWELGGCADDHRLWIISQPWPDSPLAPRELLSPELESTAVADEGQDSPSLSSLLPRYVDDSCQIRLWVECSNDEGFWEQELSNADRQTQNLSALMAESSSVQSVDQSLLFAGTRLTCTKDIPRGCFSQSLRWEYPPRKSGQDKVGVANAMAEQEGQNLAVSNESVNVGVHDLAVNEDGPRDDTDDPVGLQGDALTTDSRGADERQDRMLVFLKFLHHTDERSHEESLAKQSASYPDASAKTSSNDDQREVLITRPLPQVRQRSVEVPAKVDGRRVRHRESKSADIGEPGPGYLAHAVLRGSSPLRALFEVAAYRLNDGTKPEDLGAYVEDMPCYWQRCDPMANRDSESGDVDSRARCTTSNDTGAKAHDPPHPGVACETDCEPLRDRAKEKLFLSCPPRQQRGQFAQPSRSLEHVEHNVRNGITTLGPAAEGGVESEPGPMSESGIPLDSQNRSVLTLNDVGLQGGMCLTFYRAGQDGAGEVTVRRVYREVMKDLIDRMRLLLRGEGELGRVHIIKISEVVDVCESIGYQGFRARIAHDQQKHVNARETLEYIAQGRHLAFICDSCGHQDFPGKRYHCTKCPDYDLCRPCAESPEPVPSHRYQFAEGMWKRRPGFTDHRADHPLEEVLPVPAWGCDWRS